MNETDLERTLRQFPLAAPPASLDDWVRGRRRRPWRRAALLAAAAILVAVGAGALVHLRPGAADDADARGIEARETWTRTSDEGIVVLDGEGPHRLIERDTVRRIWWHDPERDVDYEVTVPEREIILVAERSY